MERKRSYGKGLRLCVCILGLMCLGACWLYRAPSTGQICQEHSDCWDGQLCIAYVCGGLPDELPRDAEPDTEPPSPDLQRENPSDSGEQPKDRGEADPDVFDGGGEPPESREPLPEPPIEEDREPPRDRSCTLPKPEVCDGEDNDCNGRIDDMGSQSCGIGGCRKTVPICSRGTLQRCAPGSPSAEKCSDGIDNDCDGSIDENCQQCVPSRVAQTFHAGHSLTVSAVAMKPDGTQFVSVSHDGRVRLWEVSSGKMLKEFKGHRDAIHAVAFHPNGKTFATAGADKTIRLWDTTNGAIRSLQKHTRAVETLAFSPDGNTLASGSTDEVVHLWATSTGALLGTLDHKVAVLSVAIGPNNALVATGAADGQVRIWDLSSGKSLRTTRAHTGPVYAVAFHPKGIDLASGGKDKSVQIIDVASGQITRSTRSHLDAVYSVAFTSDGSAVVSASADRTIEVREVDTGALRYRLNDHQGPVRSVATNTQGAGIVVSGSEDSTMRVWETKSGKSIRAYLGHAAPVLALSYSADGKWLATAGEDDVIKLWSLPEMRPIFTMSGHQSAITSLSFDLKRSLLASGSKDNDVKLWSIKTGKALATFKGHTGPVSSVLFSPKGKYLLSASSDATLKVWDVASLPPSSVQPLRTLTGHTQDIHALAFHPTASVFASASKDRTVRLWDVQTWSTSAVLNGHTGAVLSLAFTPNGKHLFSGSEDKTVKLWPFPYAGQSPVSLSGPGDGVLRIAVNPAGTLMTTSDARGEIRLWDLSIITSPTSISLRPHNSAIYGLDFAANGNVFLSSGPHGQLLEWQCPCKPGATRSCYLGPENTGSQGLCKRGTQSCSPNGEWGSCFQSTLPTPELADGKDNNCDGRIDEGFADLQILSIVTSTTQARVGDLIQVQVCSTNAGAGDTDAFRLRLYLAVDIKDIPTRAHLLTGSPPLPNDITYSRLPASPQPNCQSVTVRIPRILPGLRILGAVIDDKQEIAERNETNNLHTISFRIIQ